MFLLQHLKCRVQSLYLFFCFSPPIYVDRKTQESFNYDINTCIDLSMSMFKGWLKGGGGKILRDTNGIVRGVCDWATLWGNTAPTTDWPIARVHLPKGHQIFLKDLGLPSPQILNDPL